MYWMFGNNFSSYVVFKSPEDDIFLDAIIIHLNIKRTSGRIQKGQLSYMQQTELLVTQHLVTQILLAPLKWLLRFDCAITDLGNRAFYWTYWHTLQFLESLQKSQKFLCLSGSQYSSFQFTNTTDTLLPHLSLKKNKKTKKKNNIPPTLLKKILVISQKLTSHLTLAKDDFTCLDLGYYGYWETLMS